MANRLTKNTVAEVPSKDAAEASGAVALLGSSLRDVHLRMTDTAEHIERFGQQA